MSAPLLTAREVAERLGVSTETVLRWARARKIPAIYLPTGAVRFYADDYDPTGDGWLARCSTGPESSDTRRHLSSAPAPLERPGAGHEELDPVTIDDATWRAG